MKRKYRIVRFKKPHYREQFKVQRRFFGNWGWWIDCGHITPNGYWFDALFYTEEGARQYIEEEKNAMESKEITI